MKILILQDDFPPHSLGGAGNVAFNIAKELKKRGEDVYIVTTTQNKSEEGEVVYRGLKIFRIYSDYNVRWRAYLSLYNPYTVKKLRRIISEFKPDVVHAHNVHLHISYYALKLAKSFGAKVILTAHDVMLFHYGKLIEYIDPENPHCSEIPNYRISPWTQLKVYKRRYNPLRNIIIRYYLKYCDNICAVSTELKEVLSQNKIRRVVVVHNGIDTSIWKEKDVTSKQHSVLFVGHPTGAKGALQTLYIMARVRESMPDATLVVAGMRDTRSESFIAKAKELDVPVSFTGWLEGKDIQGAYRDARVVVFPSVCFDTFGMVNIEAMATGCPVVATCFGGSREVVEDGITGYVRNPYDVDGFSSAIVDLIQNTNKAQKFGHAGRKRVEERFTLEKQVNEYMKLYQE